MEWDLQPLSKLIWPNYFSLGSKSLQEMTDLDGPSIPHHLADWHLADCHLTAN